MINFAQKRRGSHSLGLLILAVMLCVSFVSPIPTVGAVNSPGYPGAILYTKNTWPHAQLAATTVSAPQTEVIHTQVGDVMMNSVHVSPDGTKLAYTRCDGYIAVACSLFSSDTDGSNEIRLTVGNVNSSVAYFDWSPDSETIAYQIATPYYQIHRIDYDGTDHQVLTGTLQTVDRLPQYTPDGSKIVFYSNRDGDREIYSMNPDGSAQTRLTTSVRDDWQHRISPDGTKIVFSSNRLTSTNYDIYVMDIDGANQTRLTTVAQVDEFPTWSPDGTKIVFQSARTGLKDVYSMNANGTSQTRLTTTNDYDQYPSYSPDGAKITYSSCTDTSLNAAMTCEIYIMDANGANKVNLTNSPTIDENFPQFSPDGTKVYHLDYTRPMGSEIWRMEADGSNQTRLTQDSKDDWPSWSPDGGRVFFRRVMSNNAHDYFVMNADGSNEVNITSDTAFSSIPYYGEAWSPDSTKLLFHTNRTGNNEVFLADADGSNQVNVSNHSASDTYPVWSPDGTKIAFLSTRDRASKDIFIMDADGSDMHKVTGDLVGETIYAVMWSPDGNRLAFEGNSDIYVMDVDGSNIINLSGDVATSSWLAPGAWVPDGSGVVVENYDLSDQDIIRLATDGSGSTLFGSTFDAYENSDAVQWSPSGDRALVRGYGENDEDWLRVVRPDGSIEHTINLHELSFYTDEAYWMPDGRIMLSDRANSILYRINTDGTNLVPIGEGAMDTYPNNWHRSVQSIANLSPTANSDSATTSFNTAKLVDVLANDTDEQALSGSSLSIISNPNHGTASIESGQVKYTPAAGYSGSDSLVYQICDSFVLDQQCATTTVALTVQAMSSVPTLTPKSVTPRNTNSGEAEESTSDESSQKSAPALAITKLDDKDFRQSSEGTYVTTNPRPIFSGTATPGSAIKITVGSIELTDTADAEGRWSITPDEGLPEGDHTVRITATLDGVTTELEVFVLGIQAEEKARAGHGSEGTEDNRMWWILGGLFGLGVIGALVAAGARKFG